LRPSIQAAQVVSAAKPRLARVYSMFRYKTNGAQPSFHVCGFAGFLGKS